MNKTLAAVILLAAGTWQAWSAVAPKRIQAFCIDFNWGDGGSQWIRPPGLWADADPAEHVAWYSEVGCQCHRRPFAVSCNGYAWYKNGTVVPPATRLQARFPAGHGQTGPRQGHEGHGLLLHRRQHTLGQAHPDLSYGTPSAYHIPLTEAYLDYLCGSIAEALKLTQMDGFMIDWVWNPEAAGGQMAGLRETGAPGTYGSGFPGEANFDKNDVLTYERRALDRCWKEIQTTAMKIRRDCIIWLSCNSLLDPTVRLDHVSRS